MELKTEIENTTDTYVGAVIRHGKDNKLQGVPVPPRGRLFMTEEEMVATASAPNLPEDNPFQNGQLKAVSEARMVPNERFIPTVAAIEDNTVTAAEPEAAGPDGEGAAEEGTQTGATPVETPVPAPAKGPALPAAAKA